MPSRWKTDRPMSRQDFEARFPDEEACARYLVERRWPDGFVCPGCGHACGWALTRERPTWECSGCGRQTSVTAGTIMHRSHLPLRTWFLAAHIMASHSNGISALQRQAHPEIPRRVRLPLEPPAPHAQRVRNVARDRGRSRSGHLSRFRRAARLSRKTGPAPRHHRPVATFVTPLTGRKPDSTNERANQHVEKPASEG